MPMRKSSGTCSTFAGEIDRLPELGFADLGAVRTAERGVLQHLQRPARSLGAGSGRIIGIHRPPAGLGGDCHLSTLSDSRPSLGRGVPPPHIRACWTRVNCGLESTAARRVMGIALVAINPEMHLNLHSPSEGVTLPTMQRIIALPAEAWERMGGEVSVKLTRTISLTATTALVFTTAQFVATPALAEPGTCAITAGTNGGHKFATFKCAKASSPNNFVIRSTVWENEDKKGYKRTGSPRRTQFHLYVEARRTKTARQESHSLLRRFQTVVSAPATRLCHRSLACGSGTSEPSVSAPGEPVEIRVELLTFAIWIGRSVPACYGVVGADAENLAHFPRIRSGS